MISDIDNILIIKFLRQELTVEESQQIIEWLQSNDENKRFLFGLKETYMLSQWPEFKNKAAVDTGWDELKYRLQLEAIPQKSKWYIIRTVLSYAAIVIVLFFLGFFLRDLISHHPVQYATVETSDGQQSTVILSDGTKVRLNENSKLTYSTDFNRSSRTVFLHGEAYFEVKHQNKLPFLVHTGSYIVKDLGTTFDVDAYSDEIYTYTSVKEGKVAILQRYDQNKTIAELTPGTQLGLNRRTGEYFVKTIDKNCIADWTRGQVVIKRLSLSEMVEKIRHKYDVDFVIQQPTLDTLKYNIIIDNESLEEILNDIHFITPQVHYQYNRKNKLVIFN